MITDNYENMVRCPECKCASRRGSLREHWEDCSHATTADLRQALKEAKERTVRLDLNVSHWFQLANRWEFKFRKVKHENNQLRKKLYPNKS